MYICMYVEKECFLYMVVRTYVRTYVCICICMYVRTVRNDDHPYTNTPPSSEDGLRWRSTLEYGTMSLL